MKKASFVLLFCPVAYFADVGGDLLLAHGVTAHVLVHAAQSH